MEDALSQVGTLELPITQDYAAQQHTLKTVSTFDWIGDKILPGLLQATAIISVAAIGLFSSGLGTAIAGIGMLAFELTRAHLHNKADLNRELVLYHNDIAQALGKSPSEQLTIQDMRNAADEKTVGDKVVKPLKMELEHLAYRGNYNLLMGVVRAAVTTGGAIALHGMMSQVRDLIAGVPNGSVTFAKILAYNQPSAILVPLTGAVGLIGAATIGIENTGKKYFDTYEPTSVYHDLAGLQKLNKSETVKPEQVFAIVIKLDKELAHDIQNRLGRPYQELSHRNKIRVMQACESRAHAQSLCEAINNDALPITAIGMSACQQMDWGHGERSKLSSAKEKGATVPKSQNEIPAKSFVAEVISQRNTKAQMPPDQRVF